MNCDQMLRHNLVLYQRYDQSDQHNKKHVCETICSLFKSV